jgi:3-phenylpropionate/trans-cinnamate dioxygenase ferredoxin component
MVDFIEIGRTNDLTDGSMARVYIEGKDIVLARVDGKYYAASGRCPHMRGFLSRGKLKGTVVTCPVHGSRFDLKDGRVVRWVEGSGYKSLIGKFMSAMGIAAKEAKPLDVYAVKIDGDRIMAKIA